MKIMKDEFQALLDKYLKGLASAEETKLLDEFFDSYHKKPGDVTEISDEIKDQILQNIRARIGKNIGDRDRSDRLPLWLRVAAVISFFLAASYLLVYQRGPQAETPIAKAKHTVAPRGQKVDIRLSDGSRIKLNTNSKISYPENFTGSIREVTLEGEAYFVVAHDPARPFIVRTGYANTQVVGTSFNVHATPDATAVTLVEGKVNVSMPDGQTASLMPHEQATISRDSKSISTRKVDVEKYVSWKDNTLRFDHIKVKEAFAIMEDWYNVEIKVNDPALLNCIVTSKYENESLENVLNSFLFMLKLDFKIDGRLVTVSGTGCR